MTDEQKIALDDLFEDHKLNCYQNQSYGSAEYCQFVAYENKTNNGRDKNLTVVRVEIYDLTQDYIPKTKIINNLIEPSGNIMFLEDFLSETEIVEYLEVLTKIDMNE
jgi:hypothetical protein